MANIPYTPAMNLLAATLPEKLYAMAEDGTQQDDSHAVCWGDHGKSLVFKDTGVVLGEILPRYNIKTTKWASFAKQLQNYEFKSLESNGEIREYFHTHNKFARGKPELLREIKTKVKKSKEKQDRRHNGDKPEEEGCSSQESALADIFRGQNMFFEKQNAAMKVMYSEITSLRTEVASLSAHVVSLQQFIKETSVQKAQEGHCYTNLNLSIDEPIGSVLSSSRHRIEEEEANRLQSLMNISDNTLNEKRQIGIKRPSFNIETTSECTRATKSCKSSEFESLNILEKNHRVSETDFLDGIDMEWLEQESVLDTKRDLGNRTFVLKAVKEYGLALEDTPPEMRNDREVVLEAVKENWKKLEYASDDLKGDREVVLAAGKQNGLALVFASKVLKRDRAFVLETVMQYGWALQFASEELKQDRNFILQAVRRNWKAIQVVSETFLGDCAVAMEAVKQNGLALAFTSKEVKGDYDVVLEAVRQNGSALEYAAKDLRNEYNVVLEAVKQNGLALMYASANMKDDRIILLEAMTQNPGAFIYASDKLKSDRDVIAKVVKQDGEVLGDVSDFFDALDFSDR